MTKTLLGRGTKVSQCKDGETHWCKQVFGLYEEEVEVVEEEEEEKILVHALEINMRLYGIPFTIFCVCRVLSIVILNSQYN
jgi:hypothetical protein